MEITIKTVKFVKQEDSPVDIKLPDTDTFYFQTGARISIAVIPQWTTWQQEQGKPEVIWEYHIIIVDISLGFATTEKATMRVSDIQDIYNKKEDTQLKKLLYFLMRATDHDLRTREQFMADYNAVVDAHMAVLKSNRPTSEDKQFAWSASGLSGTISLDAILTNEDKEDEMGEWLHAWAMGAEEGDIWESKHDRYQCI